MKTRLNEMSFAELEQLTRNNNKLFHELKTIADECFTQWDIDDHLRGLPGCIEFDSYNRAYIRQYCDTAANRREIIEFCRSWERDYGVEFEGIDKAERYIDPIENDDSGYISIEIKDYRFMEEFLDHFIVNALKTITEEIGAIDEQFFDISVLIDALFGNEIIDDSYYLEDGVIYQELEDRIVA